MLSKVISGGQTGADIAGLRAAKAFGISTGGWMPRNFKTEAGPKREYMTLYAMEQTSSYDYGKRTRWNIRDSGATIIFGNIGTPGSKLTKMHCDEIGREWLNVWTPLSVEPFHVAEWLSGIGCKELNCAGNRESKAPGIEAWVYTYLCDVFGLMGHKKHET